MASMARTPDVTLSDALASLTGEELRPMVSWLSVPKPRPTRNADMAAAVEERLADGSLRRFWDELDVIQQLAVREVLYGPGDGLDRRRFRAKYGTLPKGCERRGGGVVLPMRFFLYFGDRYGDSPLFVPADVARLLLEFVPPPPEAALAAEDELPAAIERRRRGYVPKGETPKFDRVELERRDMERAAPRDLLAVLRLIDLGRVAASAKTRRASAAAVLRIAEEMDGGDFFDPTEKKDPDRQVVGPVRAFAWPWLVQAGRLAEPRGSKLALTKAGHAALGGPAEKTLRRLWKQWIGTTVLDEFSRIEDVKGQQRGRGRRAMTATAPRRRAVAEALARCPVGEWVRFDEFSRFMAAAGLEFAVTRDPWSLYIEEPRYGSLGYDGCHDMLRDRYALCLLFEYAATLGLIDVAYTDPRGARLDFDDLWGGDSISYLSRYDGLEFFRLNPLGAYCLGLAGAYEPEVPSDRAALSVFPDLRVCADMPLSPDERLTLETFANAETDGVWRLAGDRILAAIETGHDADELRAFLAARDDQPLPEMVEGFLRNVERGARAIRTVGTALLIECADEETAARLGADERMSKLCMRAGPRHLVVRTKAEAAFRKAVRELGYGMPRL